MSAKEDFLKFLDDLEQSLAKEHFEKVEEVYGASWGQPYVEILKEFKSE